MKEQYKLPDNTTTTDVKKMAAAWRWKAKVIEDMTDLKHYAFDPDIAFVSKDGKRTISLPIWFIDQIEKYINNNCCQ